MLRKPVVGHKTHRALGTGRHPGMAPFREYLASPSLTGGITMTSSPTAAPIMTSQQFLEHWQGHRALTRRVIDAFPEAELFSHSVGGMRPFSTLATEFIGMAVPTLNGVITGKWEQFA